MKLINNWVVAVLTGLCMAVSGCDDDLDTETCPQVSGSWSLGFHCTSVDGGILSGGGPAELVQDGCEIELIQYGDNTDIEWRSSGTLSETGEITFTGDFAFTAIESCSGTLLALDLVLLCETTEASCNAEGEKSS